MALVITVAGDGTGDYRTVQEAIDGIPLCNTRRTVIRILPGIYKQPVYVPKTKNLITLSGLRPEDTILTWNNTATKIDHHQASRVIGTGTFGCGSTIVEGEDFIAENITFENSAPEGSGQAVAIRVTADRCAFYNCRFLGWQDTLYLHYGKQYLKDCYIEGSVDFIFGNSTVLLEHCHIHCKSAGFITAQSRKSSQETTGYVFLRCVITGNGGTSYAYLGRPWFRLRLFQKSRTLKQRSTMESSGEMVAFPLLLTPIETNYRACTIPYRFPSDNPKKATPTELSWINLFLNSVPSYRKRAESDNTVADAPTRAEKFAQRYTEILEDFKKDPESHGGPPDCILLCRIREQVLRELGFRDIFKKVKDEENAKAMSLFENVVRLNDDIEDEAKRVENLIRGIFAGNIFDLGSAQLAELFSKDGVSFLASCQNLVPRPWVIDDLDKFILKWSKKSWKKAVIFVDNSGADVILGILPFARELLRRGTQVVLAANDLPSINDITYPELIEIMSKLKDENGQLVSVDTSNLLIANSGNDLPVIDLARVSQELSYLASDADLVILEGMGRGIETNLYAQFKCDSLKIGMVKHPEVAQFLGGRLYDCVFKYNEVLG